MTGPLVNTLPAALQATAERFPDREAVVDGDVRLTWTEYRTAVDEVARAAIAQGVSRGDRVAIWAQNSWQWCVAALGLQAAGAALVPINTRFRGREAADVVRRSGARAVFTTTGFLDNDYPSMLRTAELPLADLPVIVMSGDHGSDLSWSEFLGRAGEVSSAEARARAQEVTADDIADIVYTSGSTGSPKGVVQTHGNVVQAMTAFSDARTMTHTDRSLVLAPMFAQFGLRWLNANVICGATIVTRSTFDPATLFQLLQDERITDFAGPPTMMAALLAPAAGQFDLSALRVAVIGSTTVPPELVRSLLENKVFEHVFTAWGLTEACGPVTISPVGADVERIAGFAGTALDHVRLRVVAADGSVAGPGEEGELQVLSPTMMREYLGDPELTAATLVDGGWLRTGDLGSIDPDGYVRITDRLKDLVIVGGFNVASAEVEAMLRTCPGIKDAAVVGRPDDRLGEVPVAFVVAVDGATPDPAEVIAWCREQMANFKVPRHVEVCAALPLNASLKVDKITLRGQARAF
ncbi:AMP-binding protein [Sporichthya polymorpha]|uniref:AMP-binding protein n=1 Tax=Sporichthya polymorpha TaxID=35751 RepID=UPI00035CBAD8|nr:AMP-binding protein [Sporichthya polymorpha]